MTCPRRKSGLSAFSLFLPVLIPALAVLLTAPLLRAEKMHETGCAPIGQPSSPANDPGYAMRAVAYDSLQHGRKENARHWMRCAVDVNPADTAALSQLVYLDLDAGEKQLAVRDIEILRTQHVETPQFDLQAGYLYTDLHRIGAAKQAFRRALKFHEAGSTEKALSALDVLEDMEPSHQFAVNFDGEYMDRFGDGVLDASARYYQRLSTGGPVMAYAGVRVFKDTASNVRGVPQIFADNALLMGGGFRWQPQGAHYSVIAEGNEAYLFPHSTGHEALVPDLRTVGAYYRLWQGKSFPLGLEANGSAGYYSRYQGNGIAYAQPRVLFSLPAAGPLRITPYIGNSLAGDTNREFYNNFYEVLPGVELRLSGVASASLRAEYVHGLYLRDVTASHNPYVSSYDDFRIRMLISFATSRRHTRTAAR